MAMGNSIYLQSEIETFLVLNLLPFTLGRGATPSNVSLMKCIR